MDAHREAVQFCIQGTQAEYAGRVEEAYLLYRRAWEAAGDHYEACIAAHYVARAQQTPADILYWNQLALTHADAVGDESVRAFYPSLYWNMGHSYERSGNLEEARRYYELAKAAGFSR